MAYTTINKSSEHFNTVIYSGNNTTGRAITGVSFAPDFLWLKERTNDVGSHFLVDNVRTQTGTGGGWLQTNATDSATVDTNVITSLDSDGFTVGNDDDTNGSGDTYVGWNWKANGAGSANTAGSINSTVSANTTSGFSIVSYTGNGTGNSTIGHGLGATPKFIIVKRTSSAQSWGTLNPFFVSASEPRVIYLNQTGSYANDTNVWGTSATFNNNTFTVGDWAGSNSNGDTFIAYCFADVKGYSKMGNFFGNGNVDGTFIYTGFKPAFVMFKGNNTSDWQLWDNKRDTFNPVEKAMHPNAGGGASTDQDIDFLSNGFKIRSFEAHLNGSGVEFIFMAFAEAPLVGTNNVPCTAR